MLPFSVQEALAVQFNESASHNGIIAVTQYFYRIRFLNPNKVAKLRASLVDGFQNSVCFFFSKL